MNWEALASALKRELRGRVELAVSLARLTTYRLGGPAALLVEPAGEEDVAALGRVLQDKRVSVLALGRGSNVVVSDEGFDGVVVRMGPAFSWIAPAQDTVGLVAGAGTPLPLLANWTGRRGLTGVEFAVAIPGSLGGAVRMNAGAHDGDVASSLRWVRVFDLRSCTIDERAFGALGLFYRRSSLADHEVVLAASLDLAALDPQVVATRMETYRKHRGRTQPGVAHNAGSTFKNPPGDFAGRLVEAAGLKGFRVGGARVSEQHANFFMAAEGATSQDVHDLVFEVRARVRDEFGIELEPEIRFVGRFKERART